MSESPAKPDLLRRNRRRLIPAAIGVSLLVCLGGFLIWSNSNRLPPFSKQQYDEGYLQAFRMNMTGPAWMDYKPEFWSMQRGFDDAKSDFEKIYDHPNVGPFSYSRIERFRDVLSHIESTDDLDPAVKDVILKQLRLDLAKWESSADSENGR